MYAAVLPLVLALAPVQSPDVAPEIAGLQAQISERVETILDSTVGLRFRSGHAAGVLVSAEGHVLTVAHAMPEPGRTVRCVLRDGRELEAKTLGRDEEGDYGLVQIVEASDPWIWSPMATDSPRRVGEACLATGYPGWIAKSRGPILRFGTLKGWTDRWLRTGCMIMPGDSGGPVFNLEGEVIGISSWIDRQHDSNYAVPVQSFQASWERLLAGEVWGSESKAETNRGALPRFTELTRLGIVLDGGPPSTNIGAIHARSAAESAGVLPGDRLVSIDKVPLRSGQEAELAAAQRIAHELLLLVVERRGEEISFALERKSGSDFPKTGARTLTATAEHLASRIRPTLVSVQSTIGDSRRRIVGILVDSRGLILTKASELGVDLVTTLYDGTRLPAERVANDDATDLALLKIDGEDCATLSWFAEHEFERGQWIVSATEATGVVSNGVISTLPARVRGSRRAYLGIRMENAPEGGALIQTVEPGTAAQRAGLRSRDVIERFNDAEIKTYFDLQALLRRARPGESASISVRRDSSVIELNAMLGRRPPREKSRSERHVADTTSLSMRRTDFPVAVRHDANVAPSQCGSPLLDSSGRAIGLNIARINRTATLALPAAEVLNTLEQLIQAFELTLADSGTPQAE